MGARVSALRARRGRHGRRSRGERHARGWKRASALYSLTGGHERSDGFFQRTPNSATAAGCRRRRLPARIIWARRWCWTWAAMNSAPTCCIDMRNWYDAAQPFRRHSTSVPRPSARICASSIPPTGPASCASVTGWMPRQPVEREHAFPLRYHAAPDPELAARRRRRWRLADGGVRVSAAAREDHLRLREDASPHQRLPARLGW